MRFLQPNYFFIPKFVIYLIVLLFFFIQLLSAQELYKVRNIQFEGNKIISGKDLTDQLYMYSTGWLGENIFRDDPFLFSSEIMEKDLLRIKKYYQSKGFLNVKIDTPKLIIDDDAKTVEIHLNIQEGEPIKVDSVITYTYNFKNFHSSLPDSIWSKIENNLKLKKGSRFEDQLIEKDKETIINYFLNNGYPYVHVDFDLKVNPAALTTNILWKINKGRYSKFGNFFIKGNSRIGKSDIEKRIKFKAGDEFINSKLNETQSNVYGLGLFHVVTVRALLDSNKNNDIPVEVLIKEAPKYNTKFGIGYGKEEKFRVSVDFKILSFLGGIGTLSALGKHTAIEPYNFGLRYVHPDFIFPLTTLIIYPFIRKQTEPAFTTNRRAINTTIQRPLFEHLDASLSYILENVKIDSLSISKENFIDGFHESYDKSGISLGLTRITANPFFDPIKGWYQGITYLYSGLGLKSVYHFSRTVFEVRNYIELSEKLILAYRLKVGTITSYDSNGFIPVEERFYSGGSNSNRGWARFELGPIDDDGKPIGGNSLLESGIELRFPIWGNITGVMFSDFGNVWVSDWTYKLDKLRYSAGAGLRYKTPIGPLRFDLANPIGEGKQKLQFHISVGHAF